LKRWYRDYEQTFSPSFAEVAKMNIEGHLVPFFGELRLTELEERHLLRFIREKTAEDRKPRPLRASTVLNILSVLRRVLALAVENGDLARNPCRNLGRLLAKVERQQSEEVSRVDSWSREEIATLLGVAAKEEPRFHPFLALLIHTGCRKGEARALKWADVDWHASRILVRRSISRDRLTPPKSGKARSVVLSPGPGRDPPRSPRRAPPGVSEARLARSPRVGVLLRGRRPTRRAKSDPDVAPASPEGAGRRRSPAATPRRSSQLRESRARVGQERALGRVTARSCEPGADASRLRPCPSRGRNGPEFPRLWRHQTAPRRHRAPRGRQQRKAPPRNTATGLANAGARDRA
jgi:integrase